MRLVALLGVAGTLHFSQSDIQLELMGGFSLAELPEESEPL
jgi:hypothetical protein